MEFPTIIALNLDDKLDVPSFVRYCKTRFIDCEILIASKKQHGQVFGAKEYVFNNVSDNIVLNTLIPLVKGNKLVVVRNIDKDNYKNLDLFVTKLTQSNQICTFKKDRNKFKNFCFEYLNKFLKVLFGYKLYNGDISIISFGQNVIDILKQLENCSLYTKVQNWSGIEVVDIPQQENSKTRFKTNNKKSYTRLAIESIFLIAPLVCWILFDAIKNSFWLKTGCILSILMSFCVIFVEIILICVKRFVGENECGRIDIDENLNKGE